MDIMVPAVLSSGQGLLGLTSTSLQPKDNGVVITPHGTEPSLQLYVEPQLPQGLEVEVDSGSQARNHPSSACLLSVSMPTGTPKTQSNSRRLDKTLWR